MASASPSPEPAESDATVWLSGEIVTPLNKLIFPVLWVLVLGWAIAVAGLLADPLGVLKRARVVWAVVLAATAFMIWITSRVQRVGHSGGSLVISDYFRTVRVPFADISDVEPVWWYRGRMVRIRLRNGTVFGDTICYLPKWGAFRCLWARPDEELREIVALR